MKAFLTLEIRKSVLKLAFAFSNPDFLGLVDFNFFAKFAMVNKFSILPPTPPLVPLPLALLSSTDVASFFSSLVAWMLRV